MMKEKIDLAVKQCAALNENLSSGNIDGANVMATELSLTIAQIAEGYTACMDAKEKSEKNCGGEKPEEPVETPETEAPAAA